MIFPGSSQFNHAGKWIVSASFMETARLYALTSATIDDRWLERIGGELCRYNWSDPHWEKRSGQVVALEKVSLFGLVIVAGRKVNFAKTSNNALQEAREIFLQEALVAENLGGRYAFFRHNTSLIQRMQELENRTRRRNILVDDATIYAFYEKRLGEVYDRHSLNREIKKHKSDKFLWMNEDDIVQTAVDKDELYRFPKRLQAGVHAIRLKYSFEPGTEEDGITADIPIPILEHLNPALFEWLVPGLLEEKILGLLKGLPKQLRRRFVPLPDTASGIMDRLELYKGSLYGALETHIFKLFHVRIKRTDWHPEKLPVHLKMRFRLLDDNKKVVLSCRNFSELLNRDYKKSVQDKKNPSANIDIPPIQTDIRSWDFSAPPAPIPQKDSNNILIGFYYPMLVADQTSRSLELQYTNDRPKSLQLNKEGLRLLYSLQFPSETKALERECKHAITSHSASWLSLGMKGKASDIRNQLKKFLLDDLFSIQGEPLPTATEFSSNCVLAKKHGIIKTCNSNIDKLLKILTQRRHVQSRIEDIQQTSKGKNDPRTALCKEFQKHLQQLLPQDFLVQRKPAELANVSRYLKALEIRMERAEHSLAKDTKKAQQVAPYINRIQNLPDNLDVSPSCHQTLTEYQEMVEEFRVSVFAPELGTAYPVSEKRLKNKWQEVENDCLRVE
jgi:ATP-dependent helicase HrpA